MSWWWVVTIRTAKKKLDDDESNQNYENVTLIVGVTEIAGNSLAKILPLSDTRGGPWKVYGVARRPCPTLNADHLIDYIQCDVSDAKDARSRLSPLTDVTHVFYVIWTNLESESENEEANGSMLRNVLRTIVPHAQNLCHVCLQTRTKHYLGPFDNLEGPHHDPPFTKDMPRLQIHDFYYSFEDILFEELKKKAREQEGVGRVHNSLGCGSFSW